MSEQKKEMTFDEAYGELEKTVNALEAPDVKFEESMALYERACELVVCCRRILSDAKVRMTDINERIKKLNAAASPFDEIEE